MSSSRTTRDRLLIAAIVFVLAVLSIAAALFEVRADSPIPLDSASPAPDGALALADWLETLGHPVRRDVEVVFKIPADAGLAFVLEPAFGSGFTEEELDELARWISAGGMLIYAAENPGNQALPARFGFETNYLVEPEQNPAAAGPFFSSPPLTTPLPVKITTFFEPGVDSFTPLVAVAEGPVTALLEHGEGKLILSTTVEPFTNAGLKSAGSGAFVLNLLNEVTAGTPVWFDEWHHGRRPVESEPAGPGAWLRVTPAGRAVLFSAIVLFGWVALSGRSFGRPVPPEQEMARRTPLEYVTAIANLNQRAGNRLALLDRYRGRLKRSYGRRLRIDPDLPDGDFLTALRPFLSEEEITRLERLLTKMSRPDVSEADMVRLANESASLRGNSLTR